MKSDSNLIMPLAIFFASIIAAYILGNAIMRFKNEDRFIAFKGFSEKEVKADLVIWTIKIKMADNDLVKGNADLAQAKAKVINFLTNKGIKTNEITSKDIMVIDNEANENFGNHVFRVQDIMSVALPARSTNPWSPIAATSPCATCRAAARASPPMPTTPSQRRGLERWPGLAALHSFNATPPGVSHLYVGGIHSGDHK